MSPAWGLVVAAAAVYLGFVSTGRQNLLKLVPALLLAVLVGDPVFTAAYVLCALGDLFLLDKKRYFLHGLVAFLVAHVVFIVGLAARAPGPPPDAAGGLVGLVATGLLVALLPHTKGVLRFAVPVYAMALAGLAFAGLAHSPLAGLGAVVFMVSDSVLAWNRFRAPVPRAELIILSTYYTALFLLGLAVHLGP